MTFNSFLSAAQLIGFTDAVFASGLLNLLKKFSFVGPGVSGVEYGLSDLLCLKQLNDYSMLHNLTVGERNCK